ncbi:toxin-activating lysine-acyltransferase [Shimia sp. SDUM112013]|uniref:toxin-activating lysine-acyltransferase n=1 Tax=Shimia sp. SDUM112013 TaxID=3136160 RepID=UPI0032EDB282
MSRQFCSVHGQLPAATLARIHYPALNRGCVRFFTNSDGKMAAALIWARLDHSVTKRLLQDRIPPTEAEWTAGNTLWLLDLVAPFGHGKDIARHIARTPPEEPFYFARLNTSGKFRKIVRGDDTVVKGRVTTWHGLPETMF